MKKRGFTLIELLAVIVILAIIALIAVPIILNMINSARKGAAVDSAYGYIEAIEYQNSMNSLNTEKYEKITDGENIDVTTIDSLVKVKGTRPDSGTLTIEKGRVKDADLCIDGFNIVYDGKKASATDSKKCSGGSEEEPEIIIDDIVPCELAKETINNKEYLYIDSVEDMYAFSKSVSSGNNYSGKVVKIRNNLNFADYKPEEKPDICSTGDNSQGFSPIGTTSRPFSGTLNGNAKKISNLIIDRSSSNNVGLFGYVRNATIYGLTLENITVNGNSNVGGLLGQSYGLDVTKNTTIKEIVLKNVIVNGNSYVGGLYGNFSSRAPYVTNILLKDGSIEGKNYVSSLSPSGGIENSIVEKVEVTGDTNTSLGSTSNNIYYSNSSILNKVVYENGFPQSDVGNINFYEAAGLDTWIGGDDNGGGYYFDYKGKEIVLRSTETHPITFTLKGEGTSSNPYLISNTKEWKEVAGSTDTNKYYKLTSDLDFSKDKFYMMGSAMNSNYFYGNFNGNAKTIKNVTINASKSNNIGMFGYVKNANIYGLTLENIKVNGNTNVGTLFGHSYGLDVTKTTIVREIVLNNITVNGNTKVGGLYGTHSSKVPYITSVILKSGTITGTSDVQSLSPSGGIENSIVEKVEVTGETNTSLGSTSNNVYYSNSSILNKVAYEDGFPQSDVGDINFYEAAGLDTWIGGDDNGTKCYLDYNGKEIVIKSIENDPITFTLKGEGTSSNPYLISNTKEWKEVAGSTDTNKYYKLTSDLDFSKDKFYMMGSAMNSNYFYGIFNGNVKTIKNVKINASKVNNIGMFGYVKNANIYGLTLENIKVNGNTNVGTLFGQSYGLDVTKNTIIREIVLDGITVNGNSYVGGLYGNYSSRVPYITNILLKNGTVKGTSYVQSLSPAGGISNAIVEKVEVTGETNTSLGSTSGNYFSNSSILNKEQITNGFDPSYVDDIDYYTGKIETRIEGDTNGTGYYFDYIYSKGKVGLVNKNDTSNIPPFEATEENATNGTCTATYGKWISTCAPYTSGIYGGYAYKKADDASSTTGAACTSIISNVSYYPVYRAKVTYKCN